MRKKSFACQIFFVKKIWFGIHFFYVFGMLKTFFFFLNWRIKMFVVLSKNNILSQVVFSNYICMHHVAINFKKEIYWEKNERISQPTSSSRFSLLIFESCWKPNRQNAIHFWNIWLQYIEKERWKILHVYRDQWSHLNI